MSVNKNDFETRPAHYALELVDDCTVSAEAVLAQCLTYMSDDDIRQMLDANELSPRHMNDDDDDDDDDDDGINESMDGDHETALESVWGSNDDWRDDE
jgi:hypothetical protein